MISRLGLTVLLALPLALQADGGFEAKCAGAYCTCLSKALDEVAAVRRSIDEGVVVDALGAKASEICNEALQGFSEAVPEATGNAAKEQVFDGKVEQLSGALDAQLKGAFLRQLTLLRSKTLKRFQKEVAGSKNKGKAERDAYVTALRSFKEDAEKSLRPGSDWDYSGELASLQEAIGELYKRTKREEDLKKQAAAQMQSASTFLRIQQQQIQMYQNQLSVGGPTGFNTNFAYHIPDTPVNLVMKYQPGMKTSLNIFTPPETAYPPLGNNHFVDGKPNPQP